MVWLLLASIGSLWGVANMEAGKSSILIIMELVTAVISAAGLSGRSLDGLEWLGGGLIIVAAVLEGWRPGGSGVGWNKDA
jgi:drug/metabolite transporter (DMT)-like permease